MSNFFQWHVRLFLIGLPLFLGTAPLLYAQLEHPRDTSITTLMTTPPEDYLYFDLACDVEEWDGYFAPTQWERTSEDGMDGALTSLQDKSGDAPFILFARERSSLVSWSIEIPAAGYLSFRLLPIAAREEIRISINDRNTFYQIRSDGLYYSPYLQAGDKFSLHIPAGGSTYRWSDLLFHTNYSAVIVRPTKKSPEERYQPISSGRIQRVFFPDDEPGTWPVFDQDGDLLTTFDQKELRNTNELFEVNYLDKIVVTDGQFVLQRTFTIREKCSRGNWLRRSRNWFLLPIIPD